MQLLVIFSLFSMATLYSPNDAPMQLYGSISSPVPNGDIMAASCPAAFYTPTGDASMELDEPMCYAGLAAGGEFDSALVAAIEEFQFQNSVDMMERQFTSHTAEASCAPVPYVPPAPVSLMMASTGASKGNSCFRCEGMDVVPSCGKALGIRHTQRDRWNGTVCSRKSNNMYAKFNRAREQLGPFMNTVNIFEFWVFI